MEPTREQVSFASCDGTTTISGVIWHPEGEPRAVVQLVHGMAEHIGRYEDFARFLNERGYLVCGHDHVGHGMSVSDDGDLGHIRARDGRDILVGDVGRMRGLIRERVDTGTPHFLFGHSMGSFVVRAYIAECGQFLTGAIICGTGQIPAHLSAAGNALAHAIGALRGERYVSKLLGNLSVGTYAQALDNPETPLDWLSYRRENVRAYMEDRLSGFAFSAGGNATLMALTNEVCTLKSARRVPHELPLRFIAGDHDPVGAMGIGPVMAARMARDAGSRDVTCRIFSHMRHEILNEDAAASVMQYVFDWMEDRL